MDDTTARRFARSWIDAWNSHDLDRIIGHYTDDVVFTSPRIIEFLGDPRGRVEGRDALRHYWATALAQLPDLAFTLVDVRTGVDTVVVNYVDHRGRAVSEVLTFRGDAVCAGLAAYAPVR
jgi:ketosteroid isomerase-like protein